MRSLAVMVLRHPRLWPVAALITVAVVGLVTHLLPASGTGRQGTAPGGTRAAQTSEAASVTGGAASQDVVHGTAGTGTTSGVTAGSTGSLPVLPGPVNAKSLPMQVPSGAPAAAGGSGVPAPLAAIYTSLPYHTPTATDAWTGAADANISALLADYFPADQVANANKVSLCESGQRSVVSKPNFDGTRDHGIFQLNDGGTLQRLLSETGQDPSNVSLALDATWNVQAAARLYRQRGWQPWTCAAKLGIVAGLWSGQPGPNAH